MRCFIQRVAVLLTRRGRAPKTHSPMQGEGDQGRKMSRAFNRNEDRRVAADYADHAVPSAEDASRARGRAIEFVAYCRSLL